MKHIQKIMAVLVTAIMLVQMISGGLPASAVSGSVVSYSKTDSTVTAWTNLLQRLGEQEAPVAGRTYAVSFYAGGCYLTGNILHKGDAGYNGRNGVEGLEIASTLSLPEDVWYYDGTNLFLGDHPDPDKCLIYENNMVTVGPVTANNQAFVVDPSVNSFRPYLIVNAGKLNHYGGVGYNVASLYNGNNYMNFFRVLPEQKISLDVTPIKGTLYQGEVLSLTPAVTVDDTQTDTYGIRWTSSDSAVATVDGTGRVCAAAGGETVITATLTSVNGETLTEKPSVTIPVRVVKKQETSGSITAQMTLDPRLQRTTTLENGKAYVISSTLTDNWVLSSRFKASDRDSSYTGPVLEHFSINGTDNMWYYVEQKVNGVTKRYLRFGSLTDPNNYLGTNKRIGQLGALDTLAYDRLTLNETYGGFQISGSTDNRHLHQLGGQYFDTAVGTTLYETDIGSFWFFNTVIPGGVLKLTVGKPAGAIHVGKTEALSCTLTLDGVAVKDYQLTWTCADTGKATVSDGIITGIAPGSTTVTASVTEVNGQTLDTALKVSVSVTLEAHSWNNTTCTVPKTCTICGITEGIAAGHRFDFLVTPPTCTAKGYTTYTCSTCGLSYTGNETEALGHKYQNVTVEATCTKEGSVTGTCTACGHTKVEVLPATGHSYTSKVTKPTCTAKGYTTYTCACGYSYKANEKAALGHKYQNVTVEATCTKDGSVTGTCTTCGHTKTETIPATGHSYTSKVTKPTCTAKGYTTYTCSTCGYSYKGNENAALGHKYQNVTVEATCTKEGSVTGTCSTCGDIKVEVIPAAEHSYTSKVTKPTCTAKGYTTYTCSACGYSYKGNEKAALGHKYQNVTVEATCTKDGSVTGTCAACGYIKTETIPATGHSYTSKVTKPTCTAKGYTTYTCSTCGHSYKGSEKAALGHKYQNVTVEATCTKDGSVTGTCSTCGDIKVEVIPATGHSYTSKVTKPTCTAKGYTTYTCACGYSYKGNEKAALGHKYETVTVNATCTQDGSVTDTCTTCGDKKVQTLPATGHSHTLKVTLPTCIKKGYTTYTCVCGDSYIADEVAALGHKYRMVTVNPTCTTKGSITATCANCGDSKVQTIQPYGHSYEDGVCTVCGEKDPEQGSSVVKPTLTLKSPTLEFKDMITVNAMFTAENIEDVVEMGMITYKEKVDSVSVDTAEYVIPGTTYDVNTGRYIAHSQGIHAKYLGDTVYLACYAKLTDGSYVYTKLAPYSPVQYAAGQLKNSSDTKLKQLCAAMLNYGAEAQKFFGHNTGNLANASLTAEQKALPEAYREDMAGTVPTASTAKQGSFANNAGFSKRYPAISFEGAFCINYFFVPKYAPVGNITLYYWNVEDFNAVSVLTTANASGSMKLEQEESGEYRGDILGISAKNLSEAVYVAAVYSDGTSTWTSGVLGYSIGAYCSGQSAKGAAVAALAEATAVYGYHAKQYFG